MKADGKAARMPYVVQGLTKKEPGILPEKLKITFPKKTIHDILGGKMAAEGFYVIDEDRGERKPKDDPFKSLLSYRIIDWAFQPFLPMKPGAPGAQVTAYANEFCKSKEYLQNCPGFVGDGEEDAYRYIGQFNQPRPADILGYNDLFVLPNSVKQHWAHRLARPTSDEDYNAVVKLYNQKGEKKDPSELQKLTPDELLRAFDSVGQPFIHPPYFVIVLIIS